MPSVCQLHLLRLLSEHCGNVRVSSGWKVEDTFAKTIPFYFYFMAIFMLSSPFSSDFILTELYFNAILPVKVDRIYNNLFLFYVYNCEPIFKQVRTEWCILSLFLHLIVQYWKYNNYTKFTTLFGREFTTHSITRSAAQWASRCGADDSSIKRAGRWYVIQCRFLYNMLQLRNLIFYL